MGEEEVHMERSMDLDDTEKRLVGSKSGPPELLLTVNFSSWKSSSIHRFIFFSTVYPKFFSGQLKSGSVGVTNKQTYNTHIHDITICTTYNTFFLFR